VDNTFPECAANARLTAIPAVGFTNFRAAKKCRKPCWIKFSDALAGCG
jgi:hypothetical protein